MTSPARPRETASGCLRAASGASSAAPSACSAMVQGESRESGARRDRNKNLQISVGRWCKTRIAAARILAAQSVMQRWRGYCERTAGRRAGRGVAGASIAGSLSGSDRRRRRRFGGTSRHENETLGTGMPAARSPGIIGGVRSAGRAGMVRAIVPADERAGGRAARGLRGPGRDRRRPGK